MKQFSEAGDYDALYELLNAAQWPDGLAEALERTQEIYADDETTALEEHQAKMASLATDIQFPRAELLTTELFLNQRLVPSGFSSRNSDFWRDWYQGFLDGKPLDWELQRRVALIPDEDWEQGPEHIAELIEDIRREYAKKLASQADAKSQSTKPATKAEKAAIAQMVQANRDALAVNLAGLIEQIAEFRERVRKLNHLDDFGTDLLAFLDELSTKLETLLHDLPQDKEVVDDKKANRLALWWRDYKSLSQTKLAKYASADNAAEITIPTGIILSCTGIGALLGNPLAGSVVGGLIANQMKPSQAAKELSAPEPSPSNTP